MKKDKVQTAQRELHEVVCKRLDAISEGQNLECAYKLHLQQRWEVAKLTPCMHFGVNAVIEDDSNNGDDEADEVIKDNGNNGYIESGAATSRP